MPEDVTAAFGGARVLITGGVGLIGSALARRLAGLGAELVLLDSMVPEGGGQSGEHRRSRQSGRRGRVRVNIADIRDTAALRHLLAGQDFLFDLAGQTSHLESMNAPEHDLAVNCTAQLQLLEACREVAPEITIVHAGTRQIYGRPRYLPVDEEHPLRPPDVNGVNKMAGEAYHLMFHDVYGLDTRSLRLTNVYGPGMRIKDARQNFLGIWLRRALEGEAFEVWGGEQRRELLYVDDAVEAFLRAALTPRNGGPRAQCRRRRPVHAAGAGRGAGAGQWRRKFRSARVPGGPQAHRHRRFRHRRPPLPRV